MVVGCRIQKGGFIINNDNVVAARIRTRVERSWAYEELSVGLVVGMMSLVGRSVVGRKSSKG